MLALVGGLSIMVFNQTNSIILTAVSAVGFGALCGLINGTLVGKAKMPAFIVTLATMLIFRSAVRYICYMNP
jgi:ribose transport system permease protein